MVKTSSNRPTRADLQAARWRTVPDVLTHALRLWFVGINPGLYTAAVGHHFARPGNRFWPALYRSGFTPRQLTAFEEQELLGLGLGITNLVARATATADELEPSELVAGAAILETKVHAFRPGCIAVLGLSAYRLAFNRPKAVIGLQPELIAGTPTWVLPNPSGLNAHYQLEDLAVLLAELRRALAMPDRSCA